MDAPQPPTKPIEPEPSAPQPPSDELTLDAPAECEEAELVTVRAAWPAAPDAQLRWTQVAGPQAAFRSMTGAEIAFTPPQALESYTIELECRAESGEQTRTARCTLVVSADDDPPIAQTFVTPTSECGAMLILTGQGQNPEIRQGITYEWRQVGEGPRVALEYTDRPQAWCTPPESGEGYALSFEFGVRDGVNPETVVRVDVDIECDARFAPLAPDQELELPTGVFLETPLPRGSWVMAGRFVLTPSDPAQPAAMTMRLPYTPRGAAAVGFETREEGAVVRRFGMEKDEHDEWREPAMSGSRDLGVWPIGEPLALELAWDGRELAIRHGKPGERSTWAEPPYPDELKLVARPRNVWIGATGGKLVIEELRLKGK